MRILTESKSNGSSAIKKQRVHVAHGFSQLVHIFDGLIAIHRCKWLFEQLTMLVLT